MNSSILAVIVDKCFQLTQISQFTRSAESMKNSFFYYDITHSWSMYYRARTLETVPSFNKLNNFTARNATTFAIQK